jgi:hypothetical protein
MTPDARQLERTYKLLTSKFVLSGNHMADSYKAVLKDTSPGTCLGVGKREKAR